MVVITFIDLVIECDNDGDCGDGYHCIFRVCAVGKYNLDKQSHTLFGMLIVPK